MIRGLRHGGVAVFAVGLALVSGCSGSASESATGETKSAVAAEEVTLDVRIDSGKVTPTNSRTEATVHQPIVVRVDSDAADELHIHSDPPHTFAVEPRAGQEFRFTVTVPGRVDVELHHAGKTVTSLLIRS